jgi:hypothetical protein
MFLYLPRDGFFFFFQKPNDVVVILINKQRFADEII